MSFYTASVTLTKKKMLVSELITLPFNPQREAIWDDNRRVSYIRSVLHNYHQQGGDFTLSETGILDGEQRLSTLKRFVDSVLSPEVLATLRLLPFNQMSIDAQTRFLHRKITVIYQHLSMVRRNPRRECRNR